jgi:hypothetical protein
MGHKHIATTMDIYVKVYPGHEAAAAAALDALSSQNGSGS